VWNEQSYPDGLTAFRATERSREAVFNALRSRSVYATTQPDRILAELSVDGTRVGEADSTVTADGERTIRFEVHGTAPVESVTVVKNGDPFHVATGTTDDDAPLSTFSQSGTLTDDAPVTGPTYADGRGGDADYYYLRAQQATRRDAAYVPGGAAWLGPVWVEP